MKIEDVKVVAVVGAGAIGHAIAQEYARSGYKVHLNDVSEDRLTQALDTIKSNLVMLVDLGLVSAEQAAPTLGRIGSSTNLAATVSEADVVVEVIPENLALKQQLFRQLDDLCPAHTILVSNSSSLMPSALAGATRRPDKVLVTHYLMPPYLLPLVEVIRAPSTSDETVAVMCELLVKQDKTPVVLQKEVPGFAVNRLQAALLREAFSLVEQGVLTARDIDSIFTHALGPRWAAAGPFELMHIHGLDLWLVVLEYLLPLLASSTEPPALLRETVARGDLGGKTGKGLFPCPPEAMEELQRRIARALVKLA